MTNVTNKDTASIHAAFEQMLREITRNGGQRIGSLRTGNGSEFKSDFIKSYLGTRASSRSSVTRLRCSRTARWRSGTIFLSG